jgi:tryptophan halogenase
MALPQDRDIRRITIVGGGTSGYLTAFHLCKTFPDKQFTWIYPEENNPIGVGEGTVPDVCNFLQELGVSLTDILQHCNGSLKLGIKFDGYYEPGSTFLFPFGINSDQELYNSSLTARVIETEQIPDNILKYPDIAVHFRATDILKFMDTLVPQIPNLTIERRNASYEELEGTYDFLIDSTGFGRHIINKVIPFEENFIPLYDRLPNDRAVVYRHPYTDKESQCLPYSTFVAQEHGWIWNIPLGDHLALGYVHLSQYEDEALETFRKYVNDKFNIDVDPADLQVIKMVNGRNKQHIIGNVASIGLASGFVEPLESTGLYLTVSGIRKICSYIKGEITAEEANSLINVEFDIVVDFIIAHYKFSKRDNPYWCLTKNIPTTTFQPMDLFPIESWQFLLAGFNPEFKAPVYSMDGKELINIHKGTPYYKWLEMQRA